MADVFEEVNDDLRRDRLEKIWKRYGIILILVALLIVLGSMGLQWWRASQIETRHSAANRYSIALSESETKEAEAAALTLAGYAATAPDGFASLAWLQAAAHRHRAGATDMALDIYRQLIGRDTVDPRLQAIARLQAARILSERGLTDAVQAQLGSNLDADSVWRFSAIEIQAIAALAAGERGNAGRFYQELAGSAQAPSGLRRRASEMARIFSADMSPLDFEASAPTDSEVTQ